MLGPLVLSTVLRLSPESLAYVAAAATGQPVEVAQRLAAICWRESRCEAIGVHVIDAHLSRASWRGQVRLGHLDPDCQPYRDPAWGTRGAWGLNASDHWRWLPECYQPELLDHPLISAMVAARKFAARCQVGRRAARRSGWCRSRRRAR